MPSVSQPRNFAANPGKSRMGRKKKVDGGGQNLGEDVALNAWFCCLCGTTSETWRFQPGDYPDRARARKARDQHQRRCRSAEVARGVVRTASTFPRAKRTANLTPNLASQVPDATLTCSDCNQTW